MFPGPRDGRETSPQVGLRSLCRTPVVATHPSARRVGLQLGQNVVMPMVAIEAHQRAPLAHSLGLHLFDDFGCDARALNHDDALELPVRGANASMKLSTFE